MPNWVTNKIAIKGNEKNVLDFLNEGLKNSYVECANSIDEAIVRLIKDGKSKKMECQNIQGGIVDDIKLVKCLTMGTFRNFDDSFYRVDTGNNKRKRECFIGNDEQYKHYCGVYDFESEKQKILTGFVGWYDAFSYYYFGCKWDCEIESISVDYNDEDYIVWIDILTPWCEPIKWCEWIKETFKVKVFICAMEEGYEFNYYGEIGSVIYIDYGDFSSCDGYPKKEDFDDTEEWLDAQSDFCANKEDELVYEFINFVTK